MAVPKELYNAKFVDYIESLKILYLVDDKFKMVCDDYCANKLRAEKFRKKFEKSLWPVLVDLIENNHRSGNFQADFH